MPRAEIVEVLRRNRRNELHRQAGIPVEIRRNLLVGELETFDVGELTITDRPGRGTVVTLPVPCATPDCPQGKEVES